MSKTCELNSFTAADCFSTLGDEYLRADEVVRLVAAEEAGEAIDGQTRKSVARWIRTGVQRALLYRFAWETGLRHETILRLTVGGFLTWVTK